MSNINILVVGRNAEMKSMASEIMTNKGWKLETAVTDESAIELFQKRTFDMVVIDRSMEEESINKLRAIFVFQHPDIHIATSNTGSLAQSINEEIVSLQKARFLQMHFHDNN